MNLAFRWVFDPKKPSRYASWLRDLDTASGAYVVRDVDSLAVLYVGESHTGNLYDTVTRHFQEWNRGDRPGGRTYDRFKVQVAAIETARAEDAITLQDALILETAPRDNVHGARGIVPASLVEAVLDQEDEEAPF